MDRNDIYSEIGREYNRDRKIAEKKADSLKTSLYIKYPRLREIDKIIMSKASSLFKACIDTKITSNALMAFKNEIRMIENEKRQILALEGYELEDLEPKYKCKICNDTGVVVNKRCKCYDKRLAAKLYSMSNISEMVSKENFDTFDYDVFSTQILNGDNISAENNIKMIVFEMMKKIDDIENEPIRVLFHGDSGLGKTFLCNCIAKEFMDKGKFVVYMSASQMFSIMNRFRFARETREEEETVRLLSDCDLLIIDDLGTEAVNANTLTEFFEVLNSRLINKKSILISTNLNLKNIQNKYSDRIVSRIIGYFDIFKFIGEDIRTK